MLRKLRMLKWSARKLLLPIYGNKIRLDVGSGGNPHPLADVLVEKYIDDTHRLKAIKIDRPTILADASKMPFKDDAFDYVFSYHVLEHMPDPAAFLDEMQRVGKQGYIETPNALYERITPFDVHLLEIFHLDDTLYIHRKGSAEGDDFIGKMDLFKKDASWKSFFLSNPRFFHCCYEWKGEIKYKILNPECSTDWFEDPATDAVEYPVEAAVERTIRSRLIEQIRKWNSKKVALESLLACPECKGDLKKEDAEFKCLTADCGLKYRSEPVPDFNNPI